MLTDDLPLTEAESTILANQHDFIITKLHGSDTPDDDTGKLPASAY